MSRDVLRNIVFEILQSDEFHTQLRIPPPSPSVSSVRSRSATPNTTPTEELQHIAPSLPLHSSSATVTQNTTPAEELRRIFPSIRSTPSSNTPCTSRSRPNRFNSRRTQVQPTGRKRYHQLAFVDFKRDVILVGRSDIYKTLLGNQKYFAYSNGKDCINFLISNLHCIYF